MVAESFPSGPPGDAGPRRGGWWRELTRYHWFVLIVAAFGWLFDTMDQQLFVLARVPAMRELLAEPLDPQSADASGTKVAQVAKEDIDWYGGIATSIFLLGWASGGLAFGILGDRIGRAKTMLLTILIYSLCTGLSAFSTGFWDFAFYRFLTGLGVGGEFAVGVALVAEVMPERARPWALGLLQALSAVGNIAAALISMYLGHLESADVFKDLIVLGTPVKAWRIMFLVGVLPALLVIVIRRRLKEPERWERTAHEGAVVKKLGSYVELFGDPVLRRNAIVGLLLAFSGVVGLWGIGFFAPDLFDRVLRERFTTQGLDAKTIDGNVAFWKGMLSLMLNTGAFFGIYGFTIVTHYIGRKPAFVISFIAAALSTASVFWFLNDFTQIFWMIPIMGVCQLALFGGYAIYFPELFPTRLRSTGTSFCYNVGRFVAATGPFAQGLLAGGVFAGNPNAIRYAGVCMCSVFLIGLLVLPFAPETKGKPLPE
jgi:MFS family permease